MAQVQLIMPKMGESIMEATILKWVKQVGDEVEVDETILEIATDKVDSEVPSPVKGVIAEIHYEVDETVAVGKVIAIIATEGENDSPVPTPSVVENVSLEPAAVNEKMEAIPQVVEEIVEPFVTANNGMLTTINNNAAFFSPLVKNIAKKENVSQEQLEKIQGTGLKGRVTKYDILSFIENRKGQIPVAKEAYKSATSELPKSSIEYKSGEDEIIEMDRMRRLIAEHMVRSKKTSPHVTSFVEVDVTNIVKWREKVKIEYQAKHGEKITFTPIFIQAVAKAISDFPMINVSVDGTKIIVKKHINVGMAAALPNNNLIVPVIKNANEYNLVGLSKKVNDLARRARANQLKPEEIQGGTFTLTNVGTFGNVMGVPIINQPQVAIMSVGIIQKKPAVVETEYGDLIAIRHKMFLSLSYDHRVVDGYLGGSFLRRVGDYLEDFDKNQGF